MPDSSQAGWLEIMIRRISFFLMPTAVACLLAAQPGLAAEARKKSAEPAPPAIGMVTGPKTGTYIAIGRDIARVAEGKNIVLDVKPSGGSIDNIKRINSRENAALGIVQSDVLGFLSRSKSPDSMKMAANLRMVLPLYNEEVHVLAKRGIKSFKDLDGKVIAIGEEGSGHMLTAVNLLAMMDVAPAKIQKVSPPEGAFSVLSGEADAMIFVGGKPVRLFKNLEDLKNGNDGRFADKLKDVHFLPLNDPRMLEEYKPAKLTAEDYGFISESVPTVAVTAVLVAHDFAAGGSYSSARCKQLKTLVDTIRAQHEWLKANGHPKWKEVDVDADLPIWRKDSCAWPEAEGKRESLGNDLLKVIEKKRD